MHQEREPAVVVDGLRKTYGDKVAVDEISLSVHEGEIFGILGPNGAGKSTTVESIAGLRVGDRGRIRVHGIDPWTDRAAVTEVLGVQLQEAKLQPKITVQEALELWSAFYDDPEPWAPLAERLGLGAHLRQRFENLSGGQQQRLSIALALIGRPRVVVLDELTTGLDPRARREVWDLVRDVRDRGVTVLLVTHSMEEAQTLCDRIAIVDAGRIRALDTPAGLIDSASAATITTFETSVAIDLASLRELDGVTAARSENGTVTVEGAEGVALAVIEALRTQGVAPLRLRVAAGSLDAAYLDLTETVTDMEVLR
ncbi:ABC transporter, ATP-binding protein [Nocardioidaceae bacterium Broad-1]|uniref:ABC transporter ATP-binding protein n=1 Tax=Nocardioides luteus TaxID=1844 RepID=UPI00020289CB|nr:ABC transporter ATP-binding protein [Nocardioides luteus]EGD43383.1 ABC transporter, ATP-binding protein [Nocardioidaceae bacterium Broad-1]MBG6097764.1 ABC-2 type transport system ATP-binding protein [Nocardioides luteus]